MHFSAEVFIYTTDYCSYCVRAKKLLAKKGVTFTEIDVTDRDDLRRWIASASRQKTVPQIFINGRSIGGFDDLATLERTQQLDILLAQEKLANTAEMPQ